MDKISFFSLLDKYLSGKATPSESRLLEEYYRRLESQGMAELSAEEEQFVKEKMYRVIAGEIRRPVVRSIYHWRKIAVAASIILTIGIGSYFIFFNTPRQASSDNQPVTEIKDLPPGRDAAVLTLANGEKIILDSAKGTITTSYGIQVINLDGLLSYEGDGSTSLSIAYNTITTARGNQYQLQLEDGTKVWLNAASSLRYPVAFSGNSRGVELTGEGYFEVAASPNPSAGGGKRPFRVITDKQVVEVLGTHFNINSYNDEDAVRTTLLEGKVKVGLPSPKGEFIILQPGQQSVLRQAPATAGRQDDITIQTGVDIEKIMAWKNGWFEFDQLDLATIMRQVSRWYDVDIVYESKLTNEQFGGRLSKNVPLSVVIEMMKASGVECKLDGKKLIVRP